MSRTPVINEVSDRLALGQKITLAQLTNPSGGFGGGVRSLLALNLMGLPQRERFLHDLVWAAAGADRERRKASFLIRRQANFHVFQDNIATRGLQGTPSGLDDKAKLGATGASLVKITRPNPSMRLRPDLRRDIAQHPVHFPGDALALVLGQGVDALLDVLFDGAPIVAVAPGRFRADGGERDKLTGRTLTRGALSKQTRVIVHI